MNRSVSVVSRVPQSGDAAFSGSTALPDGGVLAPLSGSRLWLQASNMLWGGALACLALAASAVWQPAHASNVIWSVGVQSPGVIFQAASPAPVVVYPGPVVMPAPAPVLGAYAPVNRVEYWDDRWRPPHHHHGHRHGWRGYQPPPAVIVPAPRYDRPWQGGY